MYWKEEKNQHEVMYKVYTFKNEKKRTHKMTFQTKCEQLTISIAIKLLVIA